MFDMSTLEAMAYAIEGRNEEQLPAVVIDWEHETDLTAALTRPGQLQPIRHNDLKTASLHEGDLLLGRLGLTERDTEGIFEEADFIIHNGADVSFGKTWASLRLSNLQATKELAEMSLPRLIPFHYISSGSACSFATAAGYPEIRPTSVAQFPPPITAAPGYAASKWASEGFLENLHARHPDWPICIHRPSNIARAGQPHLDLVHNLRHFSRLLRTVPVAHGIAHGAIDSVNLDKVVRGVMEGVHHSDREKRGLGKKLRFLHHTGGDHLPLGDMRTWLGEFNEPASDQESCAEVEQVSFAEWARRAGEQGVHPTVVAFVQTIGKRGDIGFPHLIAEAAANGSV
ncbi:hypothetical protein DL766_002889 [Monosporascus sp. MC13-8B]|nr:hypothetical protein DL763_000375 [Monosporascus cannonballus]RYP34604.1 hypothetical protein DL766_002889 [Monosporascus sp. MC13-8B]